MSQLRPYVAAITVGAILLGGLTASAQSVFRTMTKKGEWQDDKNWDEAPYPDNQDGNSYTAFLPDNWIVNGVSSDVVLTDLIVEGDAKVRSADPKPLTLTVNSQFISESDSTFAIETGMVLELLGDSLFGGTFEFSNGGRLENRGLFTFGEQVATPDHPESFGFSGAPINDGGESADVLNDFGAVMISTKDVNLGSYTMVNRGTLDVRDGTFAVDQYVQAFEGAQTIVREGATLTGKFLDFESGYIRGNGTLRANNFLLGSGTAPLWIDPGIHPGEIGHLTFEGVPHFRTGTMFHFDIAGSEPGQYDTLSFDKSVNLDNVGLDISFSSGFIPQPGDQFPVLSAKSLNGNFNNLVDGRIEVDGGAFSVTRSGNQLILEGFTEIPPIPEPSTYTLILVGLIALAWKSNRRPGRQS